jgi:hypothetical protein
MRIFYHVDCWQPAIKIKRIIIGSFPTLSKRSMRTKPTRLKLLEVSIVVYLGCFGPINAVDVNKVLVSHQAPMESQACRSFLLVVPPVLDGVMLGVKKAADLAQYSVSNVQSKADLQTFCWLELHTILNDSSYVQSFSTKTI